jgi:ketosteroid isomerase-like protein
MKPNFIFSLSLLFLISFSNCKSTQRLKSNQQPEKNLRGQILFHVKSLNEGDVKGLEKIYSENYEGISPVTKFESKKELISKLVESQRKQNLKIEIEIIEVFVKTDMAYAVLDWKAISNFGKPNQDELYHKKHLQIWELNGKNWQLKRSLFYN